MIEKSLEFEHSCSQTLRMLRYQFRSIQAGVCHSWFSRHLGKAMQRRADLIWSHWILWDRVNGMQSWAQLKRNMVGITRDRFSATPTHVFSFFFTVAVNWKHYEGESKILGEQYFCIVAWLHMMDPTEGFNNSLCTREQPCKSLL